MASERRMAVLIDADNVSPQYIKSILTEAVNHGTPTIKRIYGDWTRPNMTGWKEMLLEHSITPIQQYAYTVGKNATDSALIIDAMDLLYAGNVEGFCIVSSDSDFTRLASRLRESGMYVVGLGEKKTPRPFVQSCEKFLYLENLLTEETIQTATQPDRAEEDVRAALSERIKAIVDEQESDSGWVLLSEAGRILNKRYPDFDTRSYGYKNLSLLAASFPEDFELRRVPTANPMVKNIYIRVRCEMEDCINNEPGNQPGSQQKLADQIKQILEKRSPEGDWVLLSTLGQILSQQIDNFDTRSYGYKSLSQLMEAFSDRFEMRLSPTADPLVKSLWVRLRK